MNLLKQVLLKEVQRALGCTEPIAVAYAASCAVKAIQEIVQYPAVPAPEEIAILLNPGAYKNAIGVIIPNTEGQTGCLIAAALGALRGDPELKMQILRDVTSQDLAMATLMVKNGKVQVACNKELDHLYIQVVVKTARDTACVVIENSHTNVVQVSVNGIIIRQSDTLHGTLDTNYKAQLAGCSISDLVQMVRDMDEDDRAYIAEGVRMNLAIAEAGSGLDQLGAYYLDQLHEVENVPGMPIRERLRYAVRAKVACATEARMNGVNLPVMSSGGSGNQGVVAILVPYEHGVMCGINPKTVTESIALSHLMNAYVKAFTGELTPICGCAVAAGLGAAVAIVYQYGELDKIQYAINNVVAGIAGILCDGAKSGCTIKVITSVDSCLHAAFTALKELGAKKTDGIIGETPEQTIRNLGKLCNDMTLVDNSIIKIIADKR